MGTTYSKKIPIDEHCSIDQVAQNALSVSRFSFHKEQPRQRTGLQL